MNNWEKSDRKQSEMEHTWEMSDTKNIEMGKSRKGLTGRALKWIAILTMLIDHTAVAFIQNGILISETAISYEAWQRWMNLYWVMRYIGRLGFPLFCFLLVEGFCYTHNVKKYIIRLGIFALISEVPFDFALFRSPFSMNNQNVYFTLLIGLVTLCGIRYFSGKGWKDTILRVLCLLGGLAAAYLLKTDYNMYGVLLIVVLYRFREQVVWRDLAAGVVLLLCSLVEITGLLAFIPMHLYNGQRGRQMRYFFYVFYPAHLLILGLIARYLIL